MITSKKHYVDEHVYMSNKQLERVTTITYLVCSLNDEQNHSREIRVRIEKTRNKCLH